MERKNNTVFWWKAAILVVGFAVLIAHFTPSVLPNSKAEISAFGLGEIMPKKEFKMLVVGDIMLDRHVRLQMQKLGSYFPFDNVIDYIIESDADIVVGNLEGPITHFPSKVVDLSNKALQFTFATTTGEVLRTVGFTHLGLANNHTLNFGPTGLGETHHFLQESELLYFGDPKNQEDISIVSEVNGVKIGFVGYHAFDYGIEKVFEEISRLRKDVDVIFVFPHWGEEYVTSPSEGIKNLARKFVDLGADAVFGAHPHVVQDVEVYKGKPIFYSLGNFIFDQDFSENTKTGLAVMADFRDSRAEFSLQPTTLLKGQVSLIPLDDPRSITLFDRIGISPNGLFTLPFEFSTSTKEASLTKVE